MSRDETQTLENIESILKDALDLGSEQPTLDYKADFDITSDHSKAELIKDIGAMMSKGGTIIIGADNSGKPSSRFTQEHYDKFDENLLRDAIRK